MVIDDPFEIAADTFCLATEYPEVADAPLWIYVLRDPSTGRVALTDCGVPSTYDGCSSEGSRRSASTSPTCTGSS